MSGLDRTLLTAELLSSLFSMFLYSSDGTASNHLHLGVKLRLLSLSRRICMSPSNSKKNGLASAHQ